MKEQTKKKLVIGIIILSIVGLLISSYLLQIHLNPAEGVCDINNVVSCLLTNTSSYSELLDLPVAWFGIIWFLMLIVLSWKALKAEEGSVAGLFWWNVAGIAFVMYMIIAEFILKSLCIYCTVVHGIVVMTLVLSSMLWKAEENKANLPTMFKKFQWWILGIIIVIIASYFGYS